MFRKIFASMIALTVIGCVMTVAVVAGDQAAVEQAEQASDAWLKLVDEGNYKESWNQLASVVKPLVTEEKWAQEAGAARQTVGPLIARKLKLAQYSTSLPGAPDGQYVVIQYDTVFENKKSAVETVTPMLDRDGQWHVSGYFISKR